MIRYLMIATLLCVGLHARNAQAQPDCNDWNSESFFESATAADVRRCLAAGAEVNARAGSLSDGVVVEGGDGFAGVFGALLGAAVAKARTGGWTPLHFAARYGTTETVVALIKAGADIEARAEDISYNDGQMMFMRGGTRDGWTPLYLAARYGTTETVAALIKAGADVNARAAGGLTPLHFAARYGDARTVATLIKAGANTRAKTNDGRLPADLAEDNDKVRNHDIFRALNAARRE
ncbi:MAG: ankyrin repeat domain-containing protein [Hyphomonadaceae bacterium]|nr:ankyrin repeat domain-containing protein [Hyphomonadaceae bacterium]